MEHLTYVPSAGEFFLWHEGPGAPSPVGVALGKAGWPAPAYHIHSMSGGGRRAAEGWLIEMIDALPILGGAAAAEAGALWGWARLARLALEQVAEGRILPYVRARHRGGDARPAGWEARWAVVPEAHAAAELHHLAEELGPRLLARVLHACADTLVREAGWRGAVVRLAGSPAAAWEQRLVHALADVHPAFAGPDEEGAAAWAREVNDWARDQAGGGLLPSPPSWQAAEPLRHVADRLIARAAALARRLLQDHAAPRTLPAGA